MSISFDDVVHVSRLARLDFKENEFEEITEQLGSILNYISSLNELDTKDVLPTSHVLSIKNVFREDIVNEPNVNEIEKMAPEFKNGCFLVPKVLD
jgi:aspartyl-tRNA(Asn)/glutamyl-tRNA(Gln) amidotransferase subunit C|tara:strand:+ start:1079 stop:1363 length:285 start_codon:yes stop_codon:yes gene_type:complete